MKTIIYFTRFFFVNLFTIPKILNYDRLLKQQPEEESNKHLFTTTNKWAMKMVKNSGATIEVSGLDHLPTGNFLLVANHQSNFDVPIIMGYIPRLMGFVAKKELGSVPIISHWMKRLGCVFLDRSNIRQSMTMLKEVSNHLKSGKTYVLFPEGTRSKGEEMKMFKSGSLRIAVKSGVPIVPVTIDGSYKLLEEQNKIVSETVHLTVHRPVETNGLSKEEEKALAKKIHDIIKAKL